MTGRVRPDALPFISVTTTLSFAEFLPFWGARHAALGRKLPYADDGAVIRTVFLDGSVAEHTPDEVWAETGVKALDDTIAAFCRVGEADPVSRPGRCLRPGRPLPLAARCRSGKVGPSNASTCSPPYG